MNEASRRNCMLVAAIALLAAGIVIYVEPKNCETAAPQQHRATPSVATVAPQPAASSGALAVPSWFANLAQQENLSEVTRLTFNGNEITNDDLRFLTELPNLEVLKLYENPITDDGLRHLRKLRKLRVLRLDETRISDAGLAQLKDLPRLELLYLSNTSVTDVGLQHLLACKNLVGVDVFGTQVSDDGARGLEIAMGVRVNR